MFSENRQSIRYGSLYFVALIGLGACAPTAQNVPVQNVPPTGVPATGSAQGVQNLNQLNSLQTEIRELRNLLEEQQFELENLRQRQQDLFQGLDQRLRVTETIQHGGNVIAADGTVTSPGMLPPLDAAGATQDPTQAPTAGMADPAFPAAVATAPQGQPGSALPTQTEVAGADQQALYDQGFDHLKQSQYSEAIELFSQLVAQFPNGGLADDASYWIGEANYVNRQYEAAIQSFRKVVAQYPQSDRVPEALLKVGYVQYDIGDYKNAKVTFEDVLRRYPDHPVSISARSRLQRIEQGISS